MEKPKAVGVLHIEPEFVALFLIEAEGPRAAQCYVAVNEDALEFQTCPDFRKWNIEDGFRLLRTSGLTADQKNTLRTNFIEQQVSALKQSFQPLEIAINKNVVDKTLFSIFGQGWGPGWKAKARAASAAYEAATGPSRYLRMRYPAVEVAFLGAVYLAVKHGFNQPSFAERQAEDLQRILGPEKGILVAGREI